MGLLVLRPTPSYMAVACAYPVANLLFDASLKYVTSVPTMVNLVRRLGALCALALAFYKPDMTFLR